MRIIALFFVTLLAACAAQAAGPSASFDLNSLVRAHPLYGTLAQYDRQIAALRATLHVPEFAQKDQAFGNAAAAVRNSLQQSASRTRQIAAMPSPDVRALEAGRTIQAPTERGVRSRMQQTYSDQALQLRAEAQRATDRYRAQLVAQQNRALNDYLRSVHARVQQAYASRRQQLYEKEAALALQAAKADAPKRLAIRTKLRTLVLNDDARRALQAQADALERHEDAIVDAQRRRDKATLAAFLPPLQARADADIAHMRAQLQKRTAANLAARERVLAAQNATSQARLNLGPAVRPASHSPNDMQSALNDLLQSKAADPNVFLTARDDLVKQFAAVRGADKQATQSTWTQIGTLETMRAQLYNDIVSQIMRDARSIAHARGLSAVYPAARAPAGSVDITKFVRSDFMALAK